MDLSDSAAVQRIWQRVGLTPQPGTPSATSSAPSITPGTPDALPDCLPQWIAAEQVSCRRCQAMARCAGRRRPKRSAASPADRQTTPASSKRSITF